MFRIGFTAATVVLVLSALNYQAGSAQESGSVSVTVSAEAVGITITGGTIDLGGPHASNAFLWAHPTGSAQALPPTITNSGNVDIGYLDVTFSGTAGQEASCVGGGSWAAHASSTAEDRFVLEAWASTNTSTSTFISSASAVTPGTGSGDILPTTVASGDAVPLLLRLQMPNPPTTGSDGCTIGLTVTAAAE